MDLLNQRKLRPSLAILMLLISYPSFAAVVYTPALPEMGHFFHVHRGVMQQSMTTYLFGYALGQLIYGPIANAFGRKKSIYLGITLSLIGSFGCILAKPFVSLPMLFIFRFVQALGASCGITMTFTYINDCFSVKEARRVSSVMPISFALMPVLGILIGGFLTHYLAWEYCFYFLITFGLLLFILATRLPEPNQSNDRYAVHPIRVWISYLDVLKDTRMLLFALIVGCGVALYYIFSSMSPFIVITDLKESVSTFGGISLVLGLGYLFGAFLSRWLLKLFSPKHLLFIGICIESFFALMMLICFVIGKVNLFTLFFPMTMIFFGQSFVFSYATQLGMEGSKDRATTSSMMSFIFIGFSVLSVLLISAVHRKVAYELPLYLTLFLALMWIVFYFANKKLKESE